MNYLVIRTKSKAPREWIPRIKDRTSANWIMIYNFAFGVYSTGTSARVYTSLITASLIKRTLRTDSAFRSTRWRCANIVWSTRAGSLAIDFFAMTVWTTWRRLARISNDRIYFEKYFISIMNCRQIKCTIFFYSLLKILTQHWQTFYESVTSHSLWADTHRYMVYNIAYCCRCTSSWTWIFAFILDTSFIALTF